MRVQTILRATTATPDSALKTVSKVWYVRQFENLHPVLGVLEKIHISEIIHADSFTHADLGKVKKDFKK